MTIPAPSEVPGRADPNLVQAGWRAGYSSSLAAAVRASIIAAKSDNFLDNTPWFKPRV